MYHLTINFKDVIFQFPKFLLVLKLKTHLYYIYSLILIRFVFNSLNIFEHQFVL